MTERMWYGIRFVEWAGPAWVRETAAKVPPGAWLAEFDPDANDGRGMCRWSLDVRDAMQFASAVAAMDCYKTPSLVAPIRDDGQPNRPMTAATIEVVKIVAQEQP